MLKHTPIALFLTVCLALAACGGKSDPHPSARETANEQDPYTRFEIASAKALDTYALRFSMSIKSPSLGVISAEGEQDVAHNRLRMTFTMPAPGTPTGSMAMEQIMTGTTMYMKSPVFEEMLEGGKTWVKFDLAQMDETVGVDVAEMFGQTGVDPQGPVGFLGGAEGMITELGTEDVRGTPTTHFSFTVDLAAAEESLPPDLVVQPMFDDLPDSFPAEAWMDGDNMIRRIRYSMVLPTAEGQPADSMNIQMEFFDFGAKVRIVEPDAVESVDLIQLLSKAG